MAILINTPGLAVTHTGRLLKGDAAQRVIEACALMNEAHVEAEALREAARQDAEAVHAEAVAEVRQAQEHGWQAGWKSAQASLAAELAEAAAARQIALHTLAPELVDMVLEATAKVIQGVERRHLFARAVESVSGLLRQARWARLRVPPDQVEEARAALEAAGQGVMSLVTLVPDPALGPDDAVFESDRGVCNASLSVQLTALQDALRRAMATLQSAPARGSDV